MRPISVLAIVLSGVLAGCGGDGGSGSGGADYSGAFIPGPQDPPPEPKLAQEQVPPAAAASNAVDLTTQAATNVILDGYTDGEATGAPHVFLTPMEFQYSAQFEWEIDLDSENRGGNDRFPNLSGILVVNASATLEGTWLSGNAAYSLMLTAGTDITAVDPQTGIETMIPEGSTFSHDFDVTWEITNSQNWVVVATSTKSVAVEGLIVTDGDSVLDVDVSGGREVVTGIAKIDGEVVMEREISGSFTVSIDDGSNVVDVLIEFDNDGLITVTVGDDVFGPFNRQEFLEFFQAEIL